MLNSIYLMTSGAAGGGSELLLIGAMCAVFYFFIIRPQSQKAKKVKQFREAISKGNKIVTKGGIHGKIVDIKDTTVVIEVEGGHKLKIERSAISMEYSTGEESLELEQQEK